MANPDQIAELWQAVEHDLKGPVLPNTRRFFEIERKLLISEVFDVQYGEEGYENLLKEVRGFQKAAKADYGGTGPPPKPINVVPQPALFPTYNDALVVAPKTTTEVLASGEEPDIDRQSILAALFALSSHSDAVGFRDRHLERLLLPSEVNAWIERHATTPNRCQDIDDQTLIGYFRQGFLDRIDPCTRIDNAEEGTVLHELAQLVSRLVMSTPWLPSQAAWFVLTAEAPEVPKVRYWSQTVIGDVGLSLTYIHMIIDPEATHDEVRNVYRKIRDKVRPGVRSRSVESRKLSLVAFVIENAQRNDSGITNWDELKRQWNSLAYVRRKEEWGYFEVATMRTDYHEALDLIQPRVIHPNPYPPTDD